MAEVAAIKRLAVRLVSPMVVVPVSGHVGVGGVLLVGVQCMARHVLRGVQPVRGQVSALGPWPHAPGVVACIIASKASPSPCAVVVAISQVPCNRARCPVRTLGNWQCRRLCSRLLPACPGPQDVGCCARGATVSQAHHPASQMDALRCFENQACPERNRRAQACSCGSSLAVASMNLNWVTCRTIRVQ